MELNKIHIKVVDISMISLNDEIDPDSGREMIDTLMTLKMNIILLKSPIEDYGMLL